MISKKIISILIFVSLIIQISSVSMVSGEESTDADYEYYTFAQKLAEIGILEGDGSDFALGSELNRAEGIIILVRLLGKKEEALAMSEDESPFTDVPDWANGYVNYAYQEGLVEGYGNGIFGWEDTMLAKSFTTLMLRTLGYEDASGDFTWEGANTFGKQIGLIDDLLYDQMINGEFQRNLVAKLSYNTLVTDMKVMNKSDLKTLGQHLVDLGNIDISRARSIEIVREEVAETIEVDMDEIIKGISSGATPLSGPATVTKEELEAWVSSKPQNMSQEGIDLIDIYYEICNKKGLNPVIQYLQMCLETGYLYKEASQAGLDSSYHNPCGLKTKTGGDNYIADEFTKFDSWYEGIDAHTDHSALYVGLPGYPRIDTKDPRHFSYLFGNVTTVEGLSGTWAESDYDTKILKLYKDLLGQ